MEWQFVHGGCTGEEKQHGHRVHGLDGRGSALSTVPCGFSQPLSTGASACKWRLGESPALRLGPLRPGFEPGIVPAFVVSSVALREEHLTTILFAFILKELINRLPALSVHGHI